MFLLFKSSTELGSPVLSFRGATDPNEGIRSFALRKMLKHDARARDVEDLKRNIVPFWEALFNSF
jgi:hypothetical protein